MRGISATHNAFKDIRKVSFVSEAVNDANIACFEVYPADDYDAD